MNVELLALLPVAASATRSAAGAVADAVRKPFAEVLDLITNSAEATSPEEEETASVSTDANPHLDLLAQALTGKSPTEDGTISLADIRLFALDLQDSIEQRIGQLLSDAGVEIDGPVGLRFSESDGSLQVTSGTSNSVLIEAALSQDDELAGDLRHLSAIMSLLQAADAHGDFSEAYETDPVAAVAKFSELFDDRSAPRHRLRRHRAQVRFQLIPAPLGIYEPEARAAASSVSRSAPVSKAAEANAWLASSWSVSTSTIEPLR